MFTVVVCVNHGANSNITDYLEPQHNINYGNAMQEKIGGFIVTSLNFLRVKLGV
jgi:hypothetical protein